MLEQHGIRIGWYQHIFLNSSRLAVYGNETNLRSLEIIRLFPLNDLTEYPYLIEKSLMRHVKNYWMLDLYRRMMIPHGIAVWFLHQNPTITSDSAWILGRSIRLLSLILKTCQRLITYLWSYGESRSPWYLTLDPKSGYWQMKLKDSDIQKTWFVTHSGS